MITAEEINNTNVYIEVSIMKEIDGKLTFTFDKQLIIDLNVGLTLETQRTGSSSNSVIVASSASST